ncbi:tripartite tricarboxylate transporter permease [Hoeflea sp. CAU 1731]
MGGDMLDMAVQALSNILQIETFLFLIAGVFLGLIIGVVPGIGGLVGLSLLLPFTFHMQPEAALAMMMGLSAVAVTSDSIPAVLFGVPGTVASAATVMDGYPMARKGESGRALGAAFCASICGGLFGAVLLAISIPVLRPLILSITAAEMLAFSIFGLSLVAVLSGSAPAKGLGAVCIGILLSSVGYHGQSGTLRWWFGNMYLYEGLAIVPVALGLFALPEIADLVIQRKSIQSNGLGPSKKSNQFQGVRDTFRHMFLVVRCSSIGSMLGALPGIGATVIDWIAYGHAVRSEKGASETFGKGDVRGVIASEASNNAKEGGALIPTIAFGVPGTASMALVLGALLMHGIAPGPQMLSTRLDLTYTLVWSIAIANLIGGSICFLFAGQLARLALVPIGLLCPVVLAVVFVGAYQENQVWGDLFTLLTFGVLGWLMKRLRWPRPPLLLGFILGAIVERYLYISYNVYGMSWLWRPIVILILIITVYGILRPAVRSLIAGMRSPGQERQKWAYSFDWRTKGVELFVACVFLALFVVAAAYAAQWETSAKLMPQFAGWLGAFFVTIAIARMLFSPIEPAAHTADVAASGRSASSGAYYDLVTDFGELSPSAIFARAGIFLGWCLFYLTCVWLIGLLPAMFVFVVAYIRFAAKEGWKLSLLVAVPLWLLSYFLFHHVLKLDWPDSVLGTILPWLHNYPLLDIL